MSDLRIPDDVKTFGAAIRWAREKRGMTMRQFAAKMGVSVPFVSDVEHNRRHPLNVAGWAAELGVSVDELRLKKIYDDVSEWVRNNPALAELLRQKRPPRERCWCPWCRAAIADHPARGRGK